MDAVTRIRTDNAAASPSGNRFAAIEVETMSAGAIYDQKWE